MPMYAYSTARVIDSTVNSDHTAVVAYRDHVHVQPLNKADINAFSGGATHAIS